MARVPVEVWWIWKSSNGCVEVVDFIVFGRLCELDGIMEVINSHKEELSVEDLIEPEALNILPEVYGEGELPPVHLEKRGNAQHPLFVAFFSLSCRVSWLSQF
jgi:hypothetical protein